MLTSQAPLRIKRKKKYEERGISTGILRMCEKQRERERERERQTRRRKTCRAPFLSPRSKRGGNTGAKRNAYQR